jgi:2-polyprenyl-3-methyl-5-hydroxy-6-metoxy-1,4-benzoquinol methylase
MKVANHIEHYEKDADLFDYFDELNRVESDYTKRLHEAIFSFIEENKNILDIGSGSGWLSKGKKMHAGLTMVDLSAKNLERIREISKGADLNYVLADAAELPFKEFTFDYIILSEVLEHLNDPAKAIERIHYSLKAGGKAIITTPYNEVIKYYLCIHCNKKTPANAHLHVFNENILSGILDKLNIKYYKFIKMGNNVFLKFRISSLLSILPFSIWKIFDSIFNIISNKPFTIITIIEKK